MVRKHIPPTKDNRGYAYFFLERGLYMSDLDKKVLENFAEENFISTFHLYKKLKTDIYENKVKIQMGVDGVDWRTFEKNEKTFAKKTCERVRKDQYFFSPFRELEVPKPPFINLRKHNKKLGKQGRFQLLQLEM
jgi:hypothetical protein